MSELSLYEQFSHELFFGDVSDYVPLNKYEELINKMLRKQMKKMKTKMEIMKLKKKPKNE